MKLKWNMIQWNATNCFQAWIFHEREFTDPITRLNPRMTEKVLFIVLVPWVSLESFLFLPKVVESSICRSLSHCSCLFWHFVTQNIDITQAQVRLLPSYLISKFVAWHLIKDTRYQMDTGVENHKLHVCEFLWCCTWFPLQNIIKDFNCWTSVFCK